MENRGETLSSKDGSNFISISLSLQKKHPICITRWNASRFDKEKEAALFTICNEKTKSRCILFTEVNVFG